MKRLKLVLLLLFSSFLLCFADSKPQWITSTDNKNVTNTWICFQKQINLGVKPKKAVTRIAADSKYWLWINGKLVVLEGCVKRGPNPKDTYYDNVNIAPYLKSGKNLISVLVWYYGKKGFSYNISGKAALFFNCPQLALNSDASWKARIHPAFFTPGQPDPNYRLPESNLGFDATKDIAGWESKYNAAWSNVKVEGKEGDGPWNKLAYRVIPMWKDYGLKEYVGKTVRQGAEYDTLICRLPYNAQVMPYIKLEANPNQKVTIYTDHVWIDGVYGLRAEYITKSGVQEYENKGWLNGENVYYIYPKGVKVLQTLYHETGYNTEFRGYFRCSDEFLNTLWKKAQRTLYVTMRDTYMDCPDRERGQWWGDEVNESGESFYAMSTSSHLLMKKGMYELIGWQRPTGEIFAPVPASNYDSELPGQMLSSVGYYGFWNYYLNTGDYKTLKDLYPGVKKYLNVWKLNDDGTVKFRKGGWPWGDWGDNIDKELIYNALYYIALKGQYNMAKTLGLKEDAETVSVSMTNLKEAFNKVFWTGKEYRHPNYKDDTDDRVNALAVVAGLADKDKYPAIFEVLKRCEHASPYMEKYVIEALFKMGYENYAIQRLEKRFATMVNDPVRTTLYEGWTVKGGTTNHAWTGGGLTLMSQKLCGVLPTKPGYKEFTVCPQPANVKQAETLVPTVKGDIKVAYVNDVNKFTLNVTSPKTADAIVCLPLNAKSITMNGKLIWKGGKFCGNKAAVQLVNNDASHISFKVCGGGHFAFAANL